MVRFYNKPINVCILSSYISSWTKTVMVLLVIAFELILMEESLLIGLLLPACNDDVWLMS